jgi:hypothetical protein
MRFSACHDHPRLVRGAFEALLMPLHYRPTILAQKA